MSTTKSEEKSSPVSNTILLVCDYQNGIIPRAVAKEKISELLGSAASVIASARKAKIPVVYVVVQFQKNYISANKKNARVAAFIESGLMQEGKEDTAIHSALKPEAEDAIVVKRRTSAVYATELPCILSALETKHVVIMGVSASGVVLTTVRELADRDYQLTVLSDLCPDLDTTVHQCLMEKIFPRQAAVLTSKEFISQISKTHEATETKETKQNK